MGCCKHGNTDGSCLECEMALANAILEEALEAMLNLAPRVRKERGGCFGNQQADCGCTACKIRRFLMPNAELTGVAKRSPS